MARRCLLALTAALAMLSLAAAPAAAIRATHTMSAKGELVDHWSVNDPGECGLVGDGTLTVKFQTVTARVVPYIDRYQHNGKGSWIIGVPLGKHLIKDLPRIKATGTISRVDNTTRRPMADGTACNPPDKSGCGTFPLRKPTANVGRYDRRRIAVALAPDFGSSSYPCHFGALPGWGQRVLTGGGPAGELLLKMPKPATLKHRRVVPVKATSHKSSTFTDPLTPGSATSTDDVTRKATVTFKRR